MPDQRPDQFIHDIPLLRAGLSIAADSCSLIFLNRLHLLETYAGLHTIMLTQALFDEIMRIPDNIDSTEDRTVYKKMFDEHRVSVHAVAPHPAHQCTALSAADLSLIHAYEMLKPDGILTDDKSLCSYCRKNSIPYINTPIAVFILLYNGRLSHNQYTAVLRALYDMGRYGQFVHDYMEKLYTDYCAYINYMQ